MNSASYSIFYWILNIGQVEGDVYLFRYDNYLETGDFCLRSVVRIFIYTRFLSAVQSLALFRVSTKVKTVLRAFGSGRRDPFLEPFWSLLIHMNEPRRPASRLLSPAAPLGGDEIRQSRQTYQAKGSYMEATKKKAHEWTYCPSPAHYPIFSCSLPILFCMLAGTDNLSYSEATWGSPRYREGDGIWLSLLFSLSLLSLMIQVLLECDAVLAAYFPTFRRNLLRFSPRVHPFYVQAWIVKSTNLEMSMSQSCY